MVLEYLQIQKKKLVQAFAFQPVRHESAIFHFECIKACLRNDLSCHVESTWRNMKSKLAIKFPTPYGWWSNDSPRGRLSSSNSLPPIPGSNRRQMPGVWGRGMFKLGCDWGIMYQSNRSFNIPGYLNFWKIFVQIPPSRGRKAVQMPHHRSS